MSQFQSTTKEDLNSMNAEFSKICTEEKSKSVSPKRKIYRAKRLFLGQTQNANSSNNENMMDQDAKYQNMNEAEYVQYQQSTMQKRMKRKRKFDVFSAGSDTSLHKILGNTPTFRIPHLCMFYVQINDDNKNNHNSWNDVQSQHGINATNTTNTTNPFQQQNCANINTQNTKTTATTNNAFDIMLMSSRSLQNNNNNNQLKENKNDDDDDDDNDNDDQHDHDMSNTLINDANVYMDSSGFLHPKKEECLITRSVRVLAKWVEAYSEYDAANNIVWRQFNKNGKIHEYQINRVHGISLLNFNSIQNDKQQQLKQKNLNDVKQWVLDHGYAGYICDDKYYLYQPHLYWNLIDDNKLNGYKQNLISDMFGINKPKNDRLKIKFSTTQQL